MIPIKYVVGDATKPIGQGRRIIAHVCNIEGRWGAGFVLALSAIDKLPEFSYRRWYSESLLSPVPDDLMQDVPFRLGEVKIAPFAYPDVFVANMLAQRVPPNPAIIPLSYASLYTCLLRLRELALPAGCSVHMPRIGCGLAGGEWRHVEVLIQRALCAHNIDTVVYDLPLTPK